MQSRPDAWCRLIALGDDPARASSSGLPRRRPGVSQIQGRTYANLFGLVERLTCPSAAAHGSCRGCGSGERCGEVAERMLGERH